MLVDEPGKEDGAKVKEQTALDGLQSAESPLDSSKDEGYEEGNATDVEYLTGAQDN